jgi:hypothetical protein
MYTVHTGFVLVGLYFFSLLDWVQTPVGTRDFSLLQKCLQALGLRQTPIQWVPDFFPGGNGYLSSSRRYSGHSMKLTTEKHLVLRLRMSGAYLYSPYVFMAWTG